MNTMLSLDMNAIVIMYSVVTVQSADCVLLYCVLGCSCMADRGEYSPYKIKVFWVCKARPRQGSTKTKTYF